MASIKYDIMLFVNVGETETTLTRKVFDRQDDFLTLESALEWGRGRNINDGGEYCATVRRRNGLASKVTNFVYRNGKILLWVPLFLYGEECSYTDSCEDLGWTILTDENGREVKEIE